MTEEGTRRISVFDTTLRDGEQAPGNAIEPEQKVMLALESEALGVDVIEVGFPASSPADFAATRMIAEAVTSARFATFNRALRSDIQSSMEAGGVRPDHQVQICGTGSDLHLEHKRGITRQEAVSEAVDAIRYAVGLGFTDVSFAIEDASRGSHCLLRSLIDAALAAGATTVVLADTTGCTVPQEFGELCGTVRSWLPSDVVLSTHCHDDLGLSLANALAGVSAGADEVQATLGGIGERAGNTPLEELAAVLSSKEDALGLSTSIRTERLYGAYEVLASAVSLPAQRNKAIVGVNAFATEAGMHQAGILRNPATYEFLTPSDYGRRRELLVGRHSGTSILRHLLDEMDVHVDDQRVSELYAEFVSCRDGCDSLDVVRAQLAHRFEYV